MNSAFVTSPILTNFIPRRPINRCISRPTRYSPSPRAEAVDPASAAVPPSKSPSATPPAPVPTTPQSTENSTFRHRFESLRGKNIEPVSGALRRFNDAFPRPIPIVYRTIVNEMLTTTHLAAVCAMWRFDAIFALGFDSIFSAFLRYYPDEDERTMLFNACATALKFDPELLRSATASVNDWLEGKTEEDLFSAIDAASPSASADVVGPVVEALVYIRDAGDFDWYYSRLFGIGLIRVMNAVGTELSVTNAEKWSEKIGIVPNKFASEMGNYLSNMERLKQAEQIFAEATAREAKKTADRLAEKAQAAAKQAAELENVEEQTQPTESPEVGEVEGSPSA